MLPRSAARQYVSRQVGISPRPRFEGGGWEVWINQGSRQKWSKASKALNNIGDGSLKETVEYANKHMKTLKEANDKLQQEQDNHEAPKLAGAAMPAGADPIGAASGDEKDTDPKQDDKKMEDAHHEIFYAPEEEREEKEDGDEADGPC